MAGASRAHEVGFRVRYAETDAQGIVNNANYLSYFEVGRVEWVRAAGLSYRELEEQGIGLVVVEANIRYKKAAFFDDELVLHTGLAELGRATLRFEYTLSRDGEALVSGYTSHGCIDLGSGKPRRIPEGFMTRLQEIP